MSQNVQTHTTGAATGYLVNSVTAAVGDKTVDVDTGTGAFVVGDIITFAGDPQTYVITTQSAAPATVIAIEPGLKIAPPNNAVITKKATHVMNPAFHRDAIALAVRPLEVPEDGLGSIVRSAVDPVSGLALRLEVSRQHKRTRWSFDILWGTKVVRRELGARIAG